MQIQFAGAAREVTGSKFLITTPQGKKILLDCGMFQGKGMETDSLNRNLGFDPKEVDHVILSHAHIDHSGLIPYLYALGFRGSIISTFASRDLCSLMLADSAFIQEMDVEMFNKKRSRRNEPTVDPIYTIKDAEEVMKLFIGIPFDRKFRIDDNISVKFTNSGHMLGSGVVNLTIKDGNKETRIAYTGDIGRRENRMLKPGEPFPQCDYLITESTYGNRLHPSIENVEDAFLNIIRKTCVEQGGKLIIPSFAIGRTQELVLVLNDYYNRGLLPKIPVFVDSPLAVNATEIYRMHADKLNDSVAEVMKYDPDPFGFSDLIYVRKAEDSKKINSLKSPAIIISASGMAEAGRIKHHLANNIEDPRNTVLIVGYTSPTSLGRRIAEKSPEVSIFGTVRALRATVESLEAFSGHGDYSEMLEFVSCQNPAEVKTTFLVHGDFEAAAFYSQQLRDRGFTDVEIPGQFDTFELE